jgi:hypothetical protein
MGPCVGTVDGPGKAPPTVPTHSMADARPPLPEMDLTQLKVIVRQHQCLLVGTDPFD